MVDFYKALQRLQMTRRKVGMLRNKTKTESKMPKPDKKAAKKSSSSKSSKSDSGSRRTSLADLWDNTDPGEASNFIGEGDHELRLNKIEYKADKKKGSAAFIHYEALSGEEEGKTGRQMYKLTDSDGGKAPGMAYLMRDLALLGYEDVKGKDIESGKAFKEVNEEQPMCLVTAKKNGQYMNYYLNGLVEDGASGKGKDTDGDGDTETEFEEGDRVKFKDDDDDEIIGNIESINKKKETAKINGEDGKKYTMDFDDLEKVEEGDGGGDADDEIKVGDKVKGENEDGDDVEGEVTKIKDDVATVKDSDGDKHKCDLSDLEKVDDDEAEAELEVGDKVKWEDDDGEDREGKITKIKGDKATVEYEDDEGDDQTAKVDLDDLEKVDDDD